MKKQLPIIISLVLFILLCVSGSYWVMQLIKPDVRKVSAPQEAKPVADVESVASLFGGMMVADTNYQLKGLIQANPMNQSEAIIEVDGSPMKSYTVDTDVIPGTALSEVYSDYILLKGNGGSRRVDLPQDTSSSQITEAMRSPVDVRPPSSQASNRAPNSGKRASQRRSRN